MRIQWLASILILTLNACHLPRNVVAPTSDLTNRGGDSATLASTAGTINGQVNPFPSRAAQATAANVMNNSAVTLLDANGQALAATLTNASGAFTLTYAASGGASNSPYYLEAVHGLNTTLPGNEVGRFRTVLQWNGTGWLSCTNAAVGGTISINQFTTALAIEKGLDNNIPIANLINKVNSTPALNAAPTVTGHPDPEINNLAASVMTSLTANLDPVSRAPAVKPAISGFLPISGSAGTMISLTGAGFAPTIAGNTVTFNGTGTPGTVLLASPTQLVVTVPAGAQTGAVTVVTSLGTVVSVPIFTITSGSTGGLSIDTMSPAEGRVGTTITLTGNFGSGPATPSVYFSAPAAYPAAQADVSAWNPTSITCTVPYGSAAGPLTVQVGAAALTSPDWFNLWLGEVTQFDNLYQTSPGFPYTLPFTGDGYANATASIGGVLYYYIVGGTSDYNQVLVYPVSNASNNILKPRQCSRLITGRAYAAANVIGNWLYVFGGSNSGGTHLTNVERAPIYADGSLGPWTDMGNLLQTARNQFCSVQRTSTNHIYLLGGYNSTNGYLNTWELFTVTPGTGAIVRSNTGTIYNGGTAAVSFQGRAVLSGTGIFLALGYNGGWVTTILSLPIQADYTLGAGTAQTASTYCHGYGLMAVIGSDVYLFGGQSGAYVEHATFNFANATITGGWISAGMNNNFTNATYNQGPPLVTPNRVVWLTGGSGIGAQIECAYVETDQSIKWWQWYGQTRHNWYLPQWLVIGRNLWRLSGYDGTQAAYNNSTEYYTLDDDGTFGPAISGPNLNYNRYGSAWVRTTNLSTNYLYCCGGSNGSNAMTTVERIAINDAAGGFTGGWTMVSNAQLYRPNSYPNGTIIGKYLYVFGGQEGSQGYAKTIQRAVINSDGTLSDFELLPNELPYSWAYGYLFRVKDYLYMVNGYWNGSVSNWVLRGKVYPNGDVGNFQWYQSSYYTAYYTWAAMIGSYVYTFGGYNGGNLSYGQRAYIRGDGNLDGWTIYQPGGWNPLIGNSTSHGPSNSQMPIYKDHAYILAGYTSGMYVQRATIR